METLNHLSDITILGVVICLIGFYLRYAIGRRRFNRRGIGGLQQFNSYSGAVATTIMEKLLNMAGTVVIIIGLLLILIDRFNHHTDKADCKPVTTQQQNINNKTIR